MIWCDDPDQNLSVRQSRPKVLRLAFRNLKNFHPWNTRQQMALCLIIDHSVTKFLLWSWNLAAMVRQGTWRSYIEFHAVFVMTVRGPDKIITMRI